MSVDTATPPQPSGCRPVVLFDGGCPLCRREIAHYRRVDRTRAVAWVNIVDEADRVERLGISVADAMARFHVRDPAGQWQTGAWGFVELWRHLPYYRRLAQLLRALRLVPLLDVAYTRFARWRLRSRCAGGKCVLAETGPGAAPDRSIPPGGTR